jgi:hypothetical protein
VLLTTPRQLTIGEICRRLSEPPHRVRYVMQTRGIAPSSRAGMAGIYTEADLTHIQSELRRIDSEKQTTCP